MTVPISLVRFSPSSASGLMPTFLTPGCLGVVAYDAEHMSLFAIVIDGAADGLAVNSQGAVCRAVGLVPRPQSGIELDRVDADQQAAHCRQAGRAVLAAAGIVDVLEELGQGSHLCGAERHLRHSMSQAGVEIGGPKPGPRAPAQGMKEHEFGPRVRAVAVPVAGEAAGAPDLDPVGGAVDGAPEQLGVTKVSARSTS